MKKLIFPLLIFLMACSFGAALPSPDGETSEPPITAPPAAAADTIFFNGRILTMDENNPTAQALALRGSGIVAVGTNDRVLTFRGDATEMIDLQDRTLMPGFVDAHSHLFGDNILWEQDPLPDQQLAIEYGLTTTAEFYVDQTILDRLISMADAGELRMRVNAYLLYTTGCGDLLGDWSKAYAPNQQIAPNLYVRGIKIFSDGGSCKAPAMSVDYPGGGRGDLFFTQDQLNQMVAEVQAAGFQVAIHALGDRALEQVQNAIAAALNGQPNTYRHRIEHNATIRPELLPRYGQIGIVPVIFGTYSTCIRTTGESKKFKYILSEEYSAWDWPWRALVDANPDLPIAWQADYHVFGTNNPLYHMWGMVTRKAVNTDDSICDPPDWLKAGALRVEEVLPMMTINSAYALFFENEIGSLQAGKLADLVILSESPLRVESDRLKDIRVLMTMINGNVEYCADGSDFLCPAASAVTGDSIPVPIGFVDRPLADVVISGTIELAGWALADDGIDRVEIYLDGILLGNATYGIPRPDVDLEYPGREGKPNFGYTYDLDTTLLADGPHDIRVVAYNTRGESAPLSPEALAVTISN